MREDFKGLLTPPKITLISKRSILFILLILLVFAVFLPWHMFTSGIGRVTALNPSERIQEINAPIGGFIEKWHVKEGARLKKGDLIVELVDADPSLMERIQRESGAAKQALESSRLALKTAQLNMDRQEQLLKQGLTSRKEFEKAKIEVSKHQIEVSKALATLTKAETQVSRQSTQKVMAPRKGRVLRIFPGEGNQLIKSGDPLIVFAPEVTTPAIEIWISGNDIPYVKKGQNARIQFEGWPSVQIPGWPSLAIGTFKARVFLVDYASSYGGKFRVLLVKGKGRWPSEQFLRLNANAKGVISLRKTLVGFEVWRQLNAFPPVEGPINDEISKLLSKNDGQKKTGKGLEKQEDKTEDKK